jgi:hypothetical protein
MTLDIGLPRLLSRKSAQHDPSKATKAISKEQPVTTSPAVDFSGRWTLTRVEGDMNQFMTDAGASWTIRKMAKGLNWGIGKAVQEISQDGDEFVIVHQQPMMNTTMKFRVGAGYQETIGVDGKPCLCNATWDGSSLMMEVKTPQGKVYAPSCRYIKNLHMVIEGKTSKGEIIRRYYTKQ